MMTIMTTIQTITMIAIKTLIPAVITMTIETSLFPVKMMTTKTQILQEIMMTIMITIQAIIFSSPESAASMKKIMTMAWRQGHYHRS